MLPPTSPACWHLGFTPCGWAQRLQKQRKTAVVGGPIAQKQRDLLLSLLAGLRQGKLSMNTDIIWGALLKSQGRAPSKDSNLDERGDSEWGKLARTGVVNRETMHPVLLLLKTWSDRCADQGDLCWEGLAIPSHPHTKNPQVRHQL